MTDRIIDLGRHPDHVWVTQHPPQTGRVIILLPLIPEPEVSELLQRVMRALQADPGLCSLLVRM